MVFSAPAGVSTPIILDPEYGIYPGVMLTSSGGRRVTSIRASREYEDHMNGFLVAWPVGDTNRIDRSPCPRGLCEHIAAMHVGDGHSHRIPNRTHACKLQNSLVS